jgi:hypothetical protein
MSRARHHTHKKEHEKHHAAGGATETGGNPHVFALAKEHHSIGHIDGAKAKPRLDRKRGGACRAAGGGLKGSDTHPYSSAHKHGGKVHGEEHPLHHGLHDAHKGHHEHHKRHTMAHHETHHEAGGGEIHHNAHPHHAGHHRGRA